MNEFFLFIAICLSVLVIACLYRAIHGPNVMDRIVSTGVIGTKTTIILLLIGIHYNRIEMFVDISLAYALLNFTATLAASKFFTERQSIVPGVKFTRDQE